MNLSERQAIFSLNVSKLIAYIFSTGFKCTLGEAFRTPEQAAIYAKQGKGIVHSLHIERLAIDLNILDCNHQYLTDFASYEKPGAYWKTLHDDNKWGGDFKAGAVGDFGHFEMRDK